MAFATQRNYSLLLYAKTFGIVLVGAAVAGWGVFWGEPRHRLHYQCASEPGSSTPTRMPTGFTKTHSAFRRVPRAGKLGSTILALRCALAAEPMSEESRFAPTWRQHRPRGHRPRGPQNQRARPRVGGDAGRTGRGRRDHDPPARGPPAHPGARPARADRIGGRADQSGAGLRGRRAGDRLRRRARTRRRWCPNGARK